MLILSDDLTLDLAGYRIVRSDQTINLTELEQRLLSVLVAHAGRVLSVAELLESVWGIPYDGSSDYVRTYVRYLRRKLGDDAAQPRYLQTVHGVGYRFVVPTLHEPCADQSQACGKEKL